MATTTAADAFGDFAQSLRWVDLAPGLRKQVKRHVLDTLGVMCAGVKETASQQLQQVVVRWGGIAESTVIGRPCRLPAPYAAFLNAFNARLHLFDDTYDVGPVHPGSAVVSAALAAAEARRVSGERFFLATLIGYELVARVSAALSPSHYASGFHNTGTCNVFGASAAAAYVYGLDAGATADALGLAGQSAAGLRQYQIDGSVTDTALNGARAAQAGIVAVEMRHGGIAGPRGILDGPWGLCRVMATDARVGCLTEGLGYVFEFAKTAIKPFATCRFTHGPVEVLLAMCREHNLRAEDIDHIQIAAGRESAQVDNRPQPISRFDAIFSHQYASAVAILRGRVGLKELDEEIRQDLAIRQLATRVSVVHDPQLDAFGPDVSPHRVTVSLKDGRQLLGESRNPPGGIEKPLSDARVREKFYSLAEPVLGRERTERVPELLSDLENAPDVKQLMSVLTIADT